MKKQLLTLLCLLITVWMSYAQNTDNTIRKIKNTFQSESFQLSGYGQMQYNLSEYPERSLSPVKVNNSFDIVRAMLFVTGKLGVNNQFGYMLLYDFGPNPRLFELYGEWLPSRAINIRYGQFKTSFTIENPASLSRLETINPSRPASALSGSAGDFNQWDSDGKVVVKTGRDVGLQLSGLLFPADDFFRLEYYAGLFNGSGMNTKDNNNHKDFIGTVYAYPMKGFKLGGSIYSGKLPAYLKEQGRITGDNFDSNRWTIGMEYKGTHFLGRTEYIASKDGELKREGYYGLLMWKLIPDKWEITGKYDYYNKNTQIKDSDISDFTFGFNYYFAYLSRIQFNYIYTGSSMDGNNNALSVQLQVFF